MKPRPTQDKIALIVIDMQADFYATDGSAAKRGKPVSKMQQTAQKINEFLKRHHSIFEQIIFTKYISGNTITPENLKKVAKKEGYTLACEVGTGLEEISGVDVPADAIVIEKPHFDAFAYTKLIEVLKSASITTVVVTGVRTEICVDVTAKRAASEGFDTIILSDLVATYDDKTRAHEFILNFFNKYYGFTMTSDQFVSFEWI